jgi:hypothetical protein
MKSNFLFLIVGAVIGAAIIYFIPKKSDDSALRKKLAELENADALKGPAFFSTLEAKKLMKDKWQELPYDGNDGPTMRRSYEDESSRLWYPLRTMVGREEQVLRGFWVDRRMLETIFAQPGQYDGIRIYFGKRANAGKREYSLVFVGTTANTMGNKSSNDSGKYYDYVDPCPTNCGGDGK